MKKEKIIFWITTTIIFLFEGVLVAFTSQSEMSKEAMKHLGYPQYFGVMLAVFKVLGSIVLILPQFPKRLKEWAYAGFAFDFIAALVSIWAVDGFSTVLIMPVTFMGILYASYRSYHKLNS